MPLFSQPRVTQAPASPLQPRRAHHLHDLLPIKGLGQNVIGPDVDGFGPQSIIRVETSDEGEWRRRHGKCPLQQILPRALLQGSFADHQRIPAGPER